MNPDPIDFSRPIPLFPLPNCVLFPGVVQPLHIFEPRYKDMIADALEDQSAVALVLLKTGWEQNYYSNPAIHDILCVGKIVAHELLDDGKYNLLLHGMSRGRLLSERKHGLYRIAMLDPIEDLTDESPNMAMHRKVLRGLFDKTALKDLTVSQSLIPLFDDSIPTARLIDVLAFTLVQDIPAKQRLLEEFDPFKRGELLLRQLVNLTQLLEAQSRESPVAWPPSISEN
ncbi:MAG TPA: LON peptidase substrate-binding domain-containing protein [Phycisphaerae bacterium]|nr:LON peptidase substrate-binding domain-containing protein [Phycisphaerae bacterium]